MKRRVQIATGLLIAVFLVWFLFRDTNWGAVWEAARGASWTWMLVCQVCIIASFFTRVKRWGYIVRTAKPVSFSDLFHATQIGFMANVVLPLRMGEAIRALVLARLARLPFSKCFAFVALDRVTDLIGLIAMMLVAALVYAPVGDILLPPEIYADPIPGSAVRGAALSVAVAFAVLLAGFVIFYFQRALALRLVGFFAPIGAAVLRGLVAVALFLPGLVAGGAVGRLRKKLDTLLGPGFTPRVQGMVAHFADGMHIFRSTADMFKTVSYSILTWLLLTASYYAALRAFDLDIPWYTAFLVISMISAMISMPGAPGFIGQFHAGVIAGVYLAAPALTGQPDTVKAVALVTHLLHQVPVLAVGLYSLYKTNLGLLELKREGEEAQEELEEEGA